MNYYVFGDSHSECFLNRHNFQVNYFRASSAKGLNNPNSINGVNQQILNIVNTLPNNSNLIFFFGKVDMDFILNYKYNTTNKTDFNDYTIEIVYSYIEFIKNNITNHNIFVCEIPISHINDENLLSILHDKRNLDNINLHVSETDKNIYSNFDKIIPYKERIDYYTLFNKELAEKCKTNHFKFLEINKYFLNEKGDYEIPLKYIKNDKFDHHLNNNISELYLSLEFFVDNI